MKRLFLALAVVLIFQVGGCSSGGDGRTAESKKAVDGLESTRQELVRAKGEVQQVNASLDRLAAGGNLEQTYKQYTKEVADVRTAAARARARARAQDMRERERQYVAKWEKEMEQVSSPELKQGAEQRRATFRQDFGRVTTAAQSARDAYQPYIRELTDIQTALANDLTPQGVGAAKPAITKAKSEGQTLVQRIDALIAELDNVSGSMSPTAGAQTSGK